MAFFPEVDEQVAVLRQLLGDDARPEDLLHRVFAMPDGPVTQVLAAAGVLRQCAERLEIIGAGVVAARSGRDAGHDGFAQSRGHRNPTSFVQETTGATKAEASRQVRLGTSLLEGAGLTDAGQQGDGPAGTDGTTGSDGLFGDGPDVGDGGAGGTADSDTAASSGPLGGDDPDADNGPGEGPRAGSGSDDAPGAGEAGSASGTRSEAPLPWHAPLGVALLNGTITPAQHDAILRGLGTPPAARDDATGEPNAGPPSGPDAATIEAWRAAAEHLIAEASERTVEELGAAARLIRDRLDPEGAERRFLERYARRSFRTWRDSDGIRHASMVCDDEGGAFLDTLLNAALRPRRGGPRFVDPADKTRAQQLAHDPRSLDQLAYDLILDLLRAGVLADVRTVFGARQAGVRIITISDGDGSLAPIAHTEDGLQPVPEAAVQQRICDTGTLPSTIDPAGNPLNVGREKRLFTPAQRVALATRDGGCRWRGCDRPASYCESHHIDEWTADHGRTDIDRGILLCRFHHMELHHNGWRITRDGTDDFVLHHPSGETITLYPRAALTYAWAGIDPPLPRFHPTAV